MVAVASLLVIALAAPRPILAQMAESGTRVRLGAHAIGMVSRVDPGIGGVVETEGYLTQPMIHGHATLWSGLFTIAGTLNLEGLTMPGGELAPGNAGEGFVDRRHPHTFMHELMATFSPRLTGIDFTLSAGRGFAPFGTDDPMTRPFVRYPANHHWSQILERWTITAAARLGMVTIEAGLFNGDEPEAPEDLAGVERVGDSRAVRATLRPAHSLELQASHAYVESPGFRAGPGLDHRQWSASARLDHALSPSSRLYVFLEMAETNEYDGDRKVFVFTSVLGETAWRPGPWTAALRFERTTRPEEERLVDPYRSQRPHAEASILGATRWNTVTAHAARSFPNRGLRFEPFAELSRSTVDEITGAIFDPLALYGSTELWSLSIGLRLTAGLQHDRMGRYGAALPPGVSLADHEMSMTGRQ